jgi:hypothetical protein
MNKYGESIFFNAPAIGLIVGNLGGGKDKEKGGSGLISPFGIDLAIMLRTPMNRTDGFSPVFCGWTFFQTNESLLLAIWRSHIAQ